MLRHRALRLAIGVVLAGLFGAAAQAQSGSVRGTIKDETGGVLPGAVVELRGVGGAPLVASTDISGRYGFDLVAPGPYTLSVTLVNFGSARRDLAVTAATRLDIVLHYTLSADVTVTGKTTFANLADVANPAESLIGVAQSASQGAITARQLDARPIQRAGEVLETVPGVVISQHSGEGKANQYYLRGFNLDHGTDFATTVAGMPVNMPTHGHGHGYSDLNFLIPELVSGVQFSKGPYFAEQGDFATAGSANINYTNSLPKPIVRIGGGAEGFARAFAAGSMTAGSGIVLGALEVEHNDGPWDVPDRFRKVNGLFRYTRGDAASSLSITGMGYRSTWDSTDQVPLRAIESDLIGRFGALDPSDGGDTYRYSASLEWQRTRNNAATKVVAYGIGYDLNLFSNFTYFLDDPDHGDQFHQADHRVVTGAKASYRRISRWGSASTQNTVGVQFRHDDIGTVGLYHTEGRRLLDAVREDTVLQSSAGFYGQNETAWVPWLRTLAGVRVDGYRFNVDSNDPANGGVVYSSIASPKGGVVLGPWRGTELYANAGMGFHSNDARGAAMTRDAASGDLADRVTPLVRATGAEVGFRTVAIPHLQTSVTAWSLSLDSELLFVGDAGTTEAGRPSHRYGLEVANYYAPRPWLIFDGDISWSNAHFTDDDPTGERIPGSVETVISGGITLDSVRNIFGSARLRYFGPRALIEDDSTRSRATSLVNLEAGYKIGRNIRLSVDVFNLLDAEDSDIDYYYTSRLRGEPADGIADVHLHPALPRTARINLVVGF